MLVGNIDSNAQIQCSFVVEMPKQQHEGITSLTILDEIQTRAEVAREAALAVATRGAMRKRFQGTNQGESCALVKCMKCRSEVLSEFFNIIQILKYSVCCSSFVTGWCGVREEKHSGDR